MRYEVESILHHTFGEGTDEVEEYKGRSHRACSQFLSSDFVCKAGTQGRREQTPDRQVDVDLKLRIGVGDTGLSEHCAQVVPDTVRLPVPDIMAMDLRDDAASAHISDKCTRAC